MRQSAARMLSNIQIDRDQFLILIYIPLFKGSFPQQTERTPHQQLDKSLNRQSASEFQSASHTIELERRIQSFLESQPFKQNRTFLESHQYKSCQLQLIIKEQDGDHKKYIKCIWVPSITQQILSFIQSYLKPSNEINGFSNQGLKYNHEHLVRQFENINKLFIVYDQILGQLYKFMQSIRNELSYQMSNDENQMEESNISLCEHERIYYVEDRLCKIILQGIGQVLALIKGEEDQMERQLLQKMKTQICNFETSQDMHVKRYHELKLLLFLFATRYSEYHRKQMVQAKIDSFLSQTYLVQIQHQLMKQRFREVIADFIQQQKWQMLEQLNALWIQITKQTQVERIVCSFTHWKKIYPFTKLSLSELILAQFRNTFQNEWISKIRRFLKIIINETIRFNSTESKNQDLFAPSGDNLFNFFKMLRRVNEMHNNLRQIYDQAIHDVVVFIKACLCHLLKEIQGLKPSQKYLNWILKRRIFLLLVIYSWTNQMIALHFYSQDILKEIKAKSVCKLHQFKLAYKQEVLKFIQDNQQQLDKTQRCANIEMLRWPVDKDMKDIKDDRDFFAMIDKVSQLEDSSIVLKGNSEKQI